MQERQKAEWAEKEEKEEKQIVGGELGPRRMKTFVLLKHTFFLFHENGLHLIKLGLCANVSSREIRVWQRRYPSYWLSILFLPLN